MVDTLLVDCSCLVCYVRFHDHFSFTRVDYNRPSHPQTVDRQGTRCHGASRSPSSWQRLTTAVVKLWGFDHISGISFSEDENMTKKTGEKWRKGEISRVYCENSFWVNPCLTNFQTQQDTGWGQF